MIANIKILEKYCIDYQNIENYAEAVKSPLKYDLHHRLEISEMQTRSDLIFLHLYFHRPPEELIFLEHGEHQRLHKANLSQDTRQKISDAHKGQLVSEETRRKLSDALKGKPSPWLGKHPSEETRQKMSEAQKGHLVSEEARKKMSDAKKGRHWHLENGKRVYTD